MVKENYIPDKGDLVWIDFNPQQGREQAGKRPALVLSPRLYNKKSGLALMCPITSQVKGYPFEVALLGGAIKGAILADQVRTLDWVARRASFIERVSHDILQEVQQKIIVLLLGA